MDGGLESEESGAGDSRSVKLIACKDMELPEYVEIRSDVMMGKPCLRGTRIPVYLILEKLGTGGDGGEDSPGLSPVAACAYSGRIAVRRGSGDE